jgi:hypothetical protein
LTEAAQDKHARQLFHTDENEQAQQGEVENNQSGTEGSFFLLLLTFADSEHKRS